MNSLIKINGEYMDISDGESGIEITHHPDGYQVLGWDGGGFFDDIKFSTVCAELEDAVHLFATKMNEWELYK